VIKKVLDLADYLTAKAKNLLTNGNHGVLLTSITLITDMCQSSNGCCSTGQVPKCNVLFHSCNIGFAIGTMYQVVPYLVQNLKSLVTTGYSPEHNESRITDPFLQVKVLQLLHVFG
jgi:AP-1 complex subunit gamma-1